MFDRSNLFNNLFNLNKGDKGDRGVGLVAGGTTGQLLAKKSNSDYDTEWIDKPAGNSSVMFTPSNPTGTTSTSGYKMMGLGSTISFTPSKYTILKFTIDGIGKTTGGTGYGYYIKCACGTGVAPANGANASGTVAGAILMPTIAITTLWSVPFSKTVIFTGLTPGVTYWFDIQLQALGGGTASLLGLTAIVQELQY
jgi:hypothetical protein